MDTETTETGVTTETGNGEGEQGAETIAVSKKDYETLNQTLGSLKRELKDLKKTKDTATETPTKTKPEEFGLLQKSFLRAAGISDAEEVELALLTAKKWGVEIDQVVDDEDFKVKLERHRTSKSNALATSNVRGSAGTTQAKLTPEYWISKGAPPTKADIPDRKTRAKIVRTMMAKASTGGKTFYND